MFACVVLDCVTYVEFKLQFIGLCVLLMWSSPQSYVWGSYEKLVVSVAVADDLGVHSALAQNSLPTSLSALRSRVMNTSISMYGERETRVLILIRNIEKIRFKLVKRRSRWKSYTSKGESLFGVCSALLWFGWRQSSCGIGVKLCYYCLDWLFADVLLLLLV